MTSALVPFLASVPLLVDAGFGDEELAMLAQRFEVQRWTHGERIFAQGDRADAFYIVVSGHVRIIQHNEGETITIGEVGPGGPFGELAAVDDLTRSADAVAVGDVEVAALPDPVFDAVLESHPRLALALLRLTMRRLRRTTERFTAEKVAHVTEVEAVSDPVELGFPYPIAAAWRRLRVLVDPLPQLEGLLDVLEATIRTLGAIAVACHQQAGVPIPFVDELLLRGVHRLTLGAWLGMLRELTEAHIADPHRLLVPGLVDLVWEQPGRRAPGYLALDDLVRVRNEIRHSTSGPLHAAQARALLDTHLPHLEAALETLGFLGAHPLLYLERMDFRDGRFQYRARRCMGAHVDFSPMELWLDEPVETGQVVVASAGDAPPRVASLAPLLAVDAAEGGDAIHDLLWLTELEADAAVYRGMRHGLPRRDARALAAVTSLEERARERLHAAEKL